MTDPLQRFEQASYSGSAFFTGVLAFGSVRLSPNGLPARFLFSLAVAGIAVALTKRTLSSLRGKRRLGHLREYGRSNANADTLTTVILLVLLLSGAVTIAFADELSGGSTSEARQDTELFLLSETENGSLVAADYSTEYRRGEVERIHVGIGNREGQSVNYTVVAKLQRIDDSGEDVVEETELGRFERRIDSGETERHEYAVQPSMRGSNLRLVFLLYRADPPESPTAENAYRTVHLWIDVADE